jgi:hypothetical protein
MKYLEYEQLEHISNFLTKRDMGGRILNGRIEAFSCKRAGEDKKLSKVLEAKMMESLQGDDMEIPTLRKRSSSLGDLSEGRTRRLLIDLISTLNASFPDYDFSNANTESFVPQSSLTYVLQRVNSYLAEITVNNPNFLDEMWRTIDEIIGLQQCEVFSYVPDMSEDPFSDGSLWSFNFFFFNKELKRICYFTCVATSLMMRGQGLYADDDDDDDDDNDNDDDDVNNSDYNNEDGGGYDEFDEGLDSDALSQEIP